LGSATVAVRKFPLQRHPLSFALTWRNIMLMLRIFFLLCWSVQWELDLNNVIMKRGLHREIWFVSACVFTQCTASSMQVFHWGGKWGAQSGATMPH
jgi:hypothetical protein